ncbi:MAG: Maf family nucleotide pyrophosphatase [Candidatus Amulumruptor caecigallinarius]|nr:Maf family nucleotide pyrophosphatase [Candidatus Amulumruptor caecigallinarius]
MLSNLKGYKIYLASKSPRRRQLLSELRIPFSVINKGGADESYPNDMPVEDVPQYLSLKKAEQYLASLTDKDLLITADTLVICEGKILGKPRNHEDAVNMLGLLSGKSHHVISGVTICSNNRKVSFSCDTEVKFAEITEDEARYYVENYSPMDKAGAYGIQEWIGCVAVEWINGSFYNVMGLPVHQLYMELKQFQAPSSI